MRSVAPGSQCLVACRRVSCRSRGAVYIPRRHAHQPQAPCAGSRSIVSGDPGALAEVGETSRCAYGVEPGRVSHIHLATTWSLTSASAERRTAPSSFPRDVPEHRKSVTLL